jgi:hypothetical protein
MEMNSHGHRYENGYGTAPHKDMGTDIYTDTDAELTLKPTLILISTLTRTLTLTQTQTKTFKDSDVRYKKFNPKCDV